jgi:8-hydroxy-5-deazaflavin:NADPH oxidoreductase
MTTIGILGSGRVATALAGKLATTGHNVTIGTRNQAESAAKWTGPAVTFADPAEMARTTAIVLNCTPGDTSLERLSALKAELDGKILIDIANATERGANGMPGNLCYPNSSLAEHLQQALPNTHVVKTLNTMLFTVIVDPQSLSTPPTAFVSGNDGAAKATVTQLLCDLGWPIDWILDLGDITTARGIEALILLVPNILRTRGFAPFALAIAK